MFAPPRRESLTSPPQVVSAGFEALLEWLEVSGWTKFLHSTLGLDLGKTGAALDRELFRPLDSRGVAGFEDFAGRCSIQPGLPSASLLYHALASPRVHPQLRDHDYPNLGHIDALENYVYALLPMQEYPVGDSALGLATFAYEYRPASRTPHGACADLVFSRTGLSRIGSQRWVYSRRQRGFSNRPAAADHVSEFAVAPARYGVFLSAKVFGTAEVSLRKEEGRDEKRAFLVPIRKVFSGDTELGGGSVAFAESHLNERLALLSEAVELDSPDYDRTRPPFRYRSSTSTVAPQVHAEFHDSDLIELHQVGSSVIVAPRPRPLVSPAVQTIAGVKRRIGFKVPAAWTSHLSEQISNRRYTTLKLEEFPFRNAVDFVFSDFVFGRGRATTGIRSPRNVPMFVNIRHELLEDGSIRYLGSPAHNARIMAGGYVAALFEDGICEGCVRGLVLTGTSATGQASKSLDHDVEPAYSLVTAPDFFPYVDGEDLAAFDDNFLEGGTESLSGGRLRANPRISLPGSSESAFPDPCVEPDCGACRPQVDKPEAYTVTAVVAAPRIRPENRPSPSEDDLILSTLPDGASNVFAPGWDVTYSGKPFGDLSVYLSTIGLGLPFPEDVKLCAAANGMWPGLSPDAARTYQGSLAPISTGLLGTAQPPTAVPMLDSEIGLHPMSAAVREHGCSSRRGWDGEYGPFLDIASASSHAQEVVVVDFRDIELADYVVNALEGHIDAEVLRDVTAAQLVERMRALRGCICALPPREDVSETKLWLVSAEFVDNWSVGARCTGLPSRLHKEDDFQRSRLGEEGSGFLYVFASVDEHMQRSSNPGRLVKRVRELFVCQVGRQRLAWRSLVARPVLPWRTTAL